MSRLLHNLIALGILGLLGATLIWPEQSGLVLQKATERLGQTTQLDVPAQGQPAKEVLTTQAITPPAKTAVTSVDYDAPFSVGNIVDATNKERIKAGLAPLSINAKLITSAELKTRDMIDNHYFEHVSPKGVSVSDLGTKAGYDFVVIGENLALGDFKNTNELLDAWMKSPGHRANILNQNYQEIGVYAARGTWEGHEVWFAVQHFGTSRNSCPTINATLKQSIDAINADLKRRQADILVKKNELESPDHPTGEEYQQKVAEFNKLVADYNALLVSSKAKVAQYNAQVAAFNTCLSKYQKK